MKQLVDAVNALHSSGICHRDLKPENVLLRETETQGLQLKLIDFNISARAGKDGRFKMITKTGTEQFMAPEMVRGCSYDQKIDVWGVGCILCYLLTGKVPYNQVGGSEPDSSTSLLRRRGGEKQVVVELTDANDGFEED
mmetsp:Transcript_8500/g.14302  ORF Transcript_8500/g.14302 Transcript_8500/m.14302 type:complete len:139 (-) Transcript_8500:307-723(-)